MTPGEILLPTNDADGAVPIDRVSRDGVEDAIAALPPPQAAWARANGFAAKAGEHLVAPGDDGAIARVLFGLGEDSDKAGRDPFAVAALAGKLPPGRYRFAEETDHDRLACLGWLLESYGFTRYRDNDRPQALLVCPPAVDRQAVINRALGSYLARDLINTPTNDMGPDQLEAAARALGDEFSATVTTISGEELERGFPLIHAVGRASQWPPRLIDLTWGDVAAARVTLVGKGVCFDTGGLDIKPASAMLLMKKDMGGAANVLGLARMIMAAGLKVRLRVLIPAVENAVAGNAFRPGDVLSSRPGVTVEVGNTDAEGRLVLADALALAGEEKPELLIDMATLTGAARVALGPDVPPFYCDDDALAERLGEHATGEHDPLWRLPLWRPYEKMLESRIANINNVAAGGFAGSITAALFLRRFVVDPSRWIHLDIFGWTAKAAPAKPAGGEAQGIRALAALIEERFGR